MKCVSLGTECTTLLNRIMIEISVERIVMNGVMLVNIYMLYQIDLFLRNLNSVAYIVLMFKLFHSEPSLFIRTL